MSLNSKEWLTGRFDPLEWDEFMVLPQAICEDLPYILHKQAASAVVALIGAASLGGIDIKVVSGFRSYFRQQEIWNGKWTGTILNQGLNLAEEVPDHKERATRILCYSAMPGTSRHHWGSDVDLNSVEPAYFDTETGKRVFDWLVSHAHIFGFARPYTIKDNDRPWGYEEEKWHWSYLPLSKPLLTAYNNEISYTDLADFEGAETANKLLVIERYVNGIHPSCKA